MPNWDEGEGPSYYNFNDDDDDDNKPQRRSIFNTPERKVHKTWNGKPVKGMESDHIMNAILFCEKKFAEGEANHKACFGGEQEFYFTGPADMFPEYANLREEWFKRLKG